jgi:hypothetical protein
MIVQQHCLMPNTNRAYAQNQHFFGSDHQHQCDCWCLPLVFALNSFDRRVSPGVLFWGLYGCCLWLLVQQRQAIMIGWIDVPYLMIATVVDLVHCMFLFSEITSKSARSLAGGLTWQYPSR